jgi:hypothetical protein
VGLEQDRRQEGRLQGEAGRGRLAKGYTTARAGTSNTRAAAQDAASSIQVAGMPATAQAALLQTLTAALSKSVAEDKGGKRRLEVACCIVQLIKRRTLVFSAWNLFGIRRRPCNNAASNVCTLAAN